MVNARFVPNADFFRALQKGNKLSAMMARGTTNYDLRSSSGALQQVLQCVRRHGVSGNPFGAPVDAAPSPAPSNPFGTPLPPTSSAVSPLPLKNGERSAAHQPVNLPQHS
jgi:hypothetical protein